MVNHAVASLSALNIRNHATTVTRSRPSTSTLNTGSEIPGTLGQPTVTKVPSANLHGTLGQSTPSGRTWHFVEATTEMEQDSIGEGMEIEQVPEGMDRPQTQSMCCYLRCLPHRHPRQNPRRHTARHPPPPQHYPIWITNGATSPPHPTSPTPLHPPPKRTLWLNGLPDFGELTRT